MSPEARVLLRLVFKHLGPGRSLAWRCPVEGICRKVTTFGKHAEEGDNPDNAIFANGKYVSLYNVELKDFVIISELENSI